MSRLSEIEARATAATEGPWAVEGGDTSDFCVAIEDMPEDRLDGICEVVGRGDDDEDFHNANFIAHARTDTPWMAAKLRTVAAFLRELPECSCSEAHTDRGLVDSGCPRCACFPIAGEIERALEGLEES